MIARKHILPKIIERCGSPKATSLFDDVLEYIITENRYTQNEEGVRNLKWCLEIIHETEFVWSWKKYIREEHGDGR
jgi:ATP-dependent Lon protease